MTPFHQRLANEALHDAYLRKDHSWTWRFVSQNVRDAIDEMLVRDKHPLAYEPGTQENRFSTLAQNHHQFNVF
jgi:hypothetical protein